MVVKWPLIQAFRYPCLEEAVLAEQETCSDIREEASLLMTLLTQIWLPGLRDVNVDGWTFNK